VYRSQRKISTEDELYAAAMRALMRRAYSIHQMRAMLERRAEEPSLAAQVMARLRMRGYLDDARYALEFARGHAQLRRQGRYRIARELRARGVPDRHIESALDAVFAETDESALLRKRLERLLARRRGPLDQRARAAIYGSLLRAGFSADAIRVQMRNMQLPAPDESSTEEI
jgi:regulatory protein